ncbi:hypothetical protein ACIP1X_10735 [Pseudomonas sp. NPDC088885]|uniref:hypothetical protein n=1 Tax=Pseudomonas sp. NPDC088885 TaxID=3364457 RepID=UPI0038129889
MKLKLILLVFLIFVACYKFAGRDVNFDVQPHRFDSCAQPANISELSWAITKPGVTSVAVYVTKVGEPETLWSSGPLIGTLKTGAWVSDGLTFVLRDQNNNFLARRTVDTTRCVGAEFGE